MNNIVCKACGNNIFKKFYMVSFLKEEYGEISEWKVGKIKGIDCKTEYICSFCGLELELGESPIVSSITMDFSVKRS
jgi:DNA-directed RNA polymerase subunit RPC12/RpoP